jgi:hypothetical protein
MPPAMPEEPHSTLWQFIEAIIQEYKTVFVSLADINATS